MSLLDGLPEVDEATIELLLSFTRRAQGKPLFATGQADATKQA